MDEPQDNTGRAKLDDWVKKQLDAAVQKLMKQGLFDNLIIEAKPAWVMPYQILIGKIRAQGQPTAFDWFICGEVPTDHLESVVASSPREAARHFAMKWQLQAARYQQTTASQPADTELQSSEPKQVEQLTEKAEALYELVEHEQLWFK